MAKAGAIWISFATVVAACSPAIPHPEAPKPAAPGSFVSSLSQATQLGSRTVTPLAIVEDSRCPANANCVWAGRVRLRVAVRDGLDTDSGEVSFGEPLALTRGGWLHLLAVCPNRIAAAAIPSADYRLHLALSLSAQPPSSEANCTVRS